MLQQAIKGRDRFDPASWSLRNWKQIEWVSLINDTIVCHTPAFIFSIFIVSNGGGEADAYVYDGQNAAALKFIHIDTVDEACFQYNWFPPLYFQHGIYIDRGTNVLQVGVQYLPEPRL